MIHLFPILEKSVNSDLCSLEQLLCGKLKEHKIIQSTGLALVVESYDSVTIDSLKIEPLVFSALYNPNGCLLNGTFAIRIFIKINNENILPEHFKVDFKGAVVRYNFEHKGFEFIKPFEIAPVTKNYLY